MNSTSNNPIVSLIIPVYNVENYLRLSLQTAANQTLDNIEVIVVNDGSTDSSLKIIKEFERKYNNFIVINKDNGGLSSARNAGLKIAKGEYVAFMDSDDHIAPNFLESLYYAAVNNDADISYCNYNYYYPESGKIFPMPFTSKTAVYDNDVALKKIITDYTIHAFAWNKLCKRSLFIDNGIDFCHMFFEDIATLPRLFYFANKVAVIDVPLYYYTQRQGSILHSMDERKINDYIASYATVRNFLEKQEDYKKYKFSFLMNGYRMQIINIFNITNLHVAKRNRKGYVKNLKSAFKSTSYLTSDKFCLSDSTVPSLPYRVMEPENLRKSVAGE